MPCYFLIARNGQETRSPRCYTAAELRAFKNAPSCYTFISELTNSVKNVGACRRGRGLRDGAAPAPAAAAPAPTPAAPVTKPAGTGFWLFKKKKKRHPMANTIYVVPSPSGRMAMRGARRKRRR